MDSAYTGSERRKFIRLDYIAPLAFKVCRKETISNLLKGYTSNISESGLSCCIKEQVNTDDIIWLSFDRSTLALCEEMERQSIIYQNGIIGKVVRINQESDNSFNIGVQFITRQERDKHEPIYSRIDFLK